MGGVVARVPVIIEGCGVEVLRDDLLRAVQRVQLSGGSHETVCRMCALIGSRNHRERPEKAALFHAQTSHSSN